MRLDRELASAANVTPSVIDAFEDGRDVLPSYVDVIRTALEAVAVGFPFELRTATLLLRV